MGFILKDCGERGQRASARPFKSFKPFKTLKPPPYILPRVAGGGKGWGIERSEAVERLERLERFEPQEELWLSRK